MPSADYKVEHLAQQKMYYLQEGSSIALTHLNGHVSECHPQPCTASTDSNLYSIINSTTGKYCSIAFI